MIIWKLCLWEFLPSEEGGEEKKNEKFYLIGKTACGNNYTTCEPRTASVFDNVIFKPGEADKQSVFQTAEYIKCLSYSTNLLIYCQDKVTESAEVEGEDADILYCNDEQ